MHVHLQFLYCTCYSYPLRLQFQTVHTLILMITIARSHTPTLTVILTIQFANVRTITIYITFTSPSLEHYFDPILTCIIAPASAVAPYIEINIDVDIDTAIALNTTFPRTSAPTALISLNIVIAVYYYGYDHVYYLSYVKYQS